ncbi:hypothetical protein [Paenibacillus hamazuiensis]|uniref:hypothetical protein n=1 Tax=Paenibacillus hamazuiensis TaxID=2936508 RepID=UPI00200FDFA2|nr:hypothetical protein [Paenibacillus hamazuiensis]
MNNQWKQSMAALMIGALAVQGSLGLPVVHGEETAAQIQPASEGASYYLTNTIQAAVKSASVQSTANGIRIAATVRLYNGGTAKARIPDFELRVRTADGVEYKLDASADNKTALKPLEVAELVFMSVIDSKDKTPVKITRLAFVNVDEYAYPKIETELLSMPLDRKVWYDAESTEPLSAVRLAWGQTFSLAGVNSNLLYTPVGYSKQHTDQGAAVLVTVVVENPGEGRETVPDFRMDARSDIKKYAGKRTEETAPQLDPGEKTYIHFAIPVENNDEPAKLQVMTTDPFKSGNDSLPLDTGKAVIALPEGGLADPAAMSAYTLGTPISVDPLSQLIDQTDISLMELHLQQNPADGYQTAIAKFKLTNKSGKPIPTPAFDTELRSPSGSAYAGVRQTNVPAALNPGLGYTLSYAFNLPQSETGEGLVLKLLDAKSAAPYKVAIASVPAPVQKETATDVLHLFPLDIKLEHWEFGTNYLSTNATYSYKLKLTLDITQQPDVVVDQNFPTLRFEAVDKLGRVLSTADAGLTGTQKLISGTQTIVTGTVQSEQFEFPITVNVYEVVDTPSGQAKRFLTTLD